MNATTNRMVKSLCELFRGSQAWSLSEYTASSILIARWRKEERWWIGAALTQEENKMVSNILHHISTYSTYIPF